MRIDVNGTRLFVDVEGAGLALDDGRLRARPTLVVLHGGPGFDHAYLRPGLAPLAGDAQLVFVDLRGQGRSDPAPAAACTLERMADDVAALCRALGFARPVVFGHSAGGFVALVLALRHRGLPAGLILCHTAPALGISNPDATPGIEQRGGPQAAAAAAQLFGGDFSPAALERFDRLVLPHYAAPGHEDVPARLMALSDLSAAVAAHFFTALASRYDVRGRLGEIDAPTLVITGRHDWVCTPVAGRAIAAGIAGARLVELPDAGHFGFSETPEPFLRAVRAHLAALR